MKKINLVLLSFFLSFSTFAKLKKQAIVEVKLNPVGSFEIKAKIRGSLIEKDGKYTSKKLQAKVKSFKTGVDLRDKHTRDKLNYKKYSHVVVSDLVASGGSGTAKIKVMNKVKSIKFKYKEIKNNFLEATFKLSLKSLGIKDINYLGVGVEDTISIRATIKPKGK